MFSISYPADEHYTTPCPGNVPSYENGVQIIAKPRRLVNLYAFNSGTVPVYLTVFDSPDQGATVNRMTVYPVAAKSFISIATHGGDRFEKGIYLFACTDIGLATGAGNVMLYKVDWMAYL